MTPIRRTIELMDFVRLHDISYYREDHQFHVVPDRIMQEFKSTDGKTFELVCSELPADSVDAMQYLMYKKECALKNDHYPRLPILPNSLRLWLFQPTLNSALEKSTVHQGYHSHLLRVTHNITSDIETVFQLELKSFSSDDIRNLTTAFAGEFAKDFPNYYMKFTPYGAETYGLGLGNDNGLNINIELEEPDLDKLVNGPLQPYHHDTGEPYCYQTTTPFGIKPELINRKFNMSKIVLPNKVRIEYSFNKSIVTKSSELIEEYLRMDSRVSPFLFMIKHVSQSKPKDVELNNHCLMIMGLAHLLSLDPPVIPNLQNISSLDIDNKCFDDDCLSNEKFWDTAIYDGKYIGAASRFHNCVASDSKVKLCKHSPVYDPSLQKLAWNSSNMMSVGELFLDFMYYYGFTFDYETFAISLKHDSKTRKKQHFRNDSLVVEDPILNGVNLGADVQNVSRVKEFFCGVFSLLWDGIEYREMLMMPKFTQFRFANIGANSTKYKPLTRKRKSIKQSRHILLIGAPKVDETKNECNCELIENSLRTYGRVRKTQNLDADTKLVALDILEKVTIPVTLNILDKTVHCVELLEVNLAT